MKKINLVQGSPEWVENRRSGIGSSDIGAIMGVSEYRTIEDVYLDKIGQGKPFYRSEAVKHGITQEPFARVWLEDHFDVKLYAHSFEDEENPYKKCSFDGITEDGTFALEIKSPYNRQRLEMYKYATNIPLDYVYQVQWDMMMAEMETMWLAIWNSFNRECFLHLYEADKPLHKKMEKESDEFWKRVLLRDPPPSKHKDLSKDNIELLDKSSLVIEAMQKKKEAEKIIKEHSKELQAVGNGANFLLHGIKYTVTAGRKTYNINQMDDDGIDVASYLKVGKDYYRPSIIKEKK